MNDLKPGVYAILDTTLGEITCRLFPDQAPKTVQNFCGLAEGTKDFIDPKTKGSVKRRYYDGLRPHLARLREAVGPGDEPATTFLADPPTARR